MLIATAFLFVIEQMSPGLVPSMKNSYVTAYGSDLSFQQSLLTYPLMQTPEAAIVDGDDLILAEGLQLVRYHLGVPTRIGLPINGYPVAMAFGERHDLFLVMRGDIERVNPVSGAVIRHVFLPPADSPTDFDLDAGGCVAYVAFLERLARIDLCADVPLLETVAEGGWFYAVRILPNGTLLVVSQGELQVRGRDGTMLRGYRIAGEKIALDSTASTAIVTSGISVLRVDLASGNVIAEQTLQRGIHARAMAVAGEWRATIPRRRRPSHP